MKKKVVAAMSGGVDSSVAAALLKERGYDVIGITLNIWPSEESGLSCTKTCCSVTDADDARRVCAGLGIPHYVLNMRDAFRDKVIRYFIAEYLHGRTPNPCIACNEHIKFDALMRRAEELGADFVASGHYARIVRDEDSGELSLCRSKDRHKDQTYVLYMLGQDRLSRLLFPCGDYTKDEIRQMAEAFGLPTSHKAESQDICFIGREGYAEFIRSNCPDLSKPGSVYSSDGKLLGTHDGIFHFTIGQRKGLGKYTNTRSFVTEIDAQSGAVRLGDENELFRRMFYVKDIHLTLKSRFYEGARVGVKIRYSAAEAPATVQKLESGSALIAFDTPQRAITPGQAAVFYENDRVLGGGIIEKSISTEPIAP